MSRYIVTVEGCDDTTYVAVELTDDEAVAVSRVAAATVAKSWNGCQPVMTITTYESAPGYARESAEETNDDE